MGKFREGKSFGATAMLHAFGLLPADAAAKPMGESGFSVGPTVQAHTHGLWLWSTPALARDPASGNPYYMFICDSEGTESRERAEAMASYDAYLFALSVLVSSNVLYNRLGVIDSQMINLLHQARAARCVQASCSCRHSFPFLNNKPL